MAFVPLAVLVFIVVAVMGGPQQFVTVVSQWGIELARYVTDWVRHL